VLAEEAAGPGQHRLGRWPAGHWQQRAGEAAASKARAGRCRYMSRKNFLFLMAH
jgi:hypothetical protein